MFDTEIKPIINGKIRKENWGGIYYLRGRAFNLTNDSGYLILSLCDGKHSIEDIIQVLKDEFNVERLVLEKDIFSLIDKMSKNNAMTWDGLKDPFNNKKIDNSPGAYNMLMKEQRNQVVNLGEVIPNGKILSLGEYSLSAPMKVLIEFTRRCNLRCVHCFADADYDKNSCEKKEELDTKTWFKIIDDLANANVFSIFVSGGEPLLRKDIFDILTHINEKDIDWCLLTNMTLIDDEMAIKLKELGCIKVEGNLDGPDAESYDRFRGVKGAFERTIKGIRACQKYNIPFRLNVTLTKLNCRQLKEIVDKAVELGVGELACVPLEIGGRGFKNQELLEITEEDKKELEPYYKELAKYVEDNYQDKLIFIPPMAAAGLDSQVLDIVDPNALMPPCGAGRLHLSISPNGNAIICPAADEEIIIEPRDLTKYSIVDVWNKSKELQNMRVQKPEQCLGCDEFRCAGGCQVRVYRKYGKIAYGPDPECGKNINSK